MRNNRINYLNFNKTKHYSTDESKRVELLEAKKEIIVSTTTTPQNEVFERNTGEAYIELMSQIITHLELKDGQSQLVAITFNVEDLSKIHENSIPFNIKKFCSNVRVASSSPFGRNLVEILLLPISRNVVVDDNAIRLSQSECENYNSYKELMLNDKVREACIAFIDQIPTLRKGVITTKTTLKSFKEEPVIENLWFQLKQSNLSQQGKYALVGLFLESILFETVSNTVKHSKARIINFLIELLSKTGV